jgi:large subunit ribosomal protein L17
MRHLKAGRKLGRNAPHRRAMYSNMVTALVTHGKIETTEAKAKELRRVADRTIHWGVGVSDITSRSQKKLDLGERAKLVHAMRMARRVIKDEVALEKLFREVAPTMVGRPGGYTRVLKTRYRVGDAAPMALVQLVGAAGQPSAPAPEPAEEPKAGKAKKGKAEKGEATPAKAEKAAKKAKAEKPAKAEKAGKGKGKKGEDE